MLGHESLGRRVRKHFLRVNQAGLSEEVIMERKPNKNVESKEDPWKVHFGQREEQVQRPCGQEEYEARK